MLYIYNIFILLLLLTVKSFNILLLLLTTLNWHTHFEKPHVNLEEVDRAKSHDIVNVINGRPIMIGNQQC